MKYHINFKKWIIMPGLLLCFTAGCADSSATDVAATVSSDAATVSAPQDAESAPQDTGTEEPMPEAAEPSPPSILEVHFIDVGQRDSILITCDGDEIIEAGYAPCKRCNP